MIDEYDVFDLIDKKQEGPYWDFKRQWYEDGKEGDMLHDIICFANNLVNRDAYIIIGVDEKNDFKICDTSKDPNRRTTQGMVDFLRAKKFAGDVRPMVVVKQFLMGYDEVDVIVIFSSNNTPFYLTERYKNVNSNNIYTRVQDTNTPIDKSAEIKHVEYLWRKRFGLESPPLERFHEYLKNPSDWEDSPTNESLKYYKYCPEFTIGYDYDPNDSRDAREYFHYYQMDNSAMYADIKLKYHQTILEQFTGIFLDGGRYFTPYPDRNGFALSRYHSWDVSYFYLVKGTLKYTVYEFYLDEVDGQKIVNRSYVDVILIFENEIEHQAFRQYAIEKWEEYDKIPSENLHLPYIPEDPRLNIDYYYESARNAQLLKRMLNDFRGIE